VAIEAPNPGQSKVHGTVTPTRFAASDDGADGADCAGGLISVDDGETV